MGQRDQDYLRKRVRDETRAALRAPDPHVAAVHVQLAQRYVQTLNELGWLARA